MFGWKLDYAMRFERHTWKVDGDGSALVEIVLPKRPRSIPEESIALGSDYSTLEGDRLVSMPIWGVVAAGQFVPIPGPTMTCQSGMILVVSFSNAGRVAIDVTYALLTVGLM